jgi:maltose O-acetyltransferase
MRANLIAGKGGMTIGSNCVIGAGALVKKSIPDNSIAVGVPARIVGSVSKNKN